MRHDDDASIRAAVDVIAVSVAPWSCCREPAVYADYGDAVSRTSELGVAVNRSTCAAARSRTSSSTSPAARSSTDG